MIKFAAEWGYEIYVEIALDGADEQAFISGEPVEVVGNGYTYEGDEFSDIRKFDGGMDGNLTVSYSPIDSDDLTDVGDGFVGSPRDCLIVD